MKWTLIKHGKAVSVIPFKRLAYNQQHSPARPNSKSYIHLILNIY